MFWCQNVNKIVFKRTKVSFFEKSKNELVPKWIFCLAQNFNLVLRLRLSEITQFRLIIAPCDAYITFYIFLHIFDHFSLTISLIFHPLRFSLTIPNQKINNFLCKLRWGLWNFCEKRSMRKSSRKSKFKKKKPQINYLIIFITFSLSDLKNVVDFIRQVDKVTQHFLWKHVEKNLVQNRPIGSLEVQIHRASSVSTTVSRILRMKV